MYNKKINCSNFIVLVGGAFQGKSLIALKLAAKLNYSGVISTDFIRNILRISNPIPEILCSTSKMNIETFNKQRQQVSDYLYKLLPFYTERQEKIILEGIHFSKDLLEFLKENGAKCFGLNNLLSWEEKVYKKLITTPITRIKSTSGEIIDYCKSKEDKANILYLEREEKYTLFHTAILNDIKKLKLPIIKYDSIDKATKELIKLTK